MVAYAYFVRAATCFAAGSKWRFSTTPFPRVGQPGYYYDRDTGLSSIPATHVERPEETERSGEMKKRVVIAALTGLIVLALLVAVNHFGSATGLRSQWVFDSVVRGIARHRESGMIAAGLRNGTVVIIDCDGASAGLSRNINLKKDVFAHALSFSPREALLAVGARDTAGPDHNNLYIIDAVRGEVVTSFRCHTGIVTALEFSADGSELYVAGMDDGEDIDHQGAIAIVDTTKWEVTGLLPGVTTTIWAIAVAGDGQYIAASNGYGRVNVWNCRNHVLMKSFVEPLRKTMENRIRDVRFSHDSQHLITSGTFGARVRSMGSFQIEAQISSRSDIWSATFLPNDNHRIAFVDKMGLWFYDAATDRGERQAHLTGDSWRNLDVDPKRSEFLVSGGKHLALYSASRK